MNCFALNHWNITHKLNDTTKNETIIMQVNLKCGDSLIGRPKNAHSLAQLQQCEWRTAQIING